MKKFISTLILLLFISSCATSYQPHGFTGGFTEERFSSDMYRITFRGNGYTKERKSIDFCLLRCAELAKEKGFSHFELVENESEKSLVTTDFGVYGTASGLKPKSSNTIWLNNSKKGYNAQSVINKIRSKYDL